MPGCTDVLTYVNDSFVNPQIAMDLSGQQQIPDCYVNLYDAQALSSDWLNGYYLLDLINLVQSWLACNDPSDVNCSWLF